MSNDDWAVRADENARTIETEIEELERGHWSMGERHYASFFGHVTEIFELFKNTRPLKREDREHLWDRFIYVRDEVQQEADDARGLRARRSSERREVVEELLNNAHNRVKAAKEYEDFDQVGGLLRDAMERMSGKGKHASEKLLQDDHDACWERYQEVQDLRRTRWEDLADSNYSRLSGRAAQSAHDANGDDPWQVKKDVQELQGEVSGAILKGFQREHLRETLNGAWDTASSRIGEIHEERDRRLREHLDRLEGALDAKRAFIDRRREIIDGHNDRIASSWNEDFVDRVRGWIDDEERKIAEVEEDIEEIEEKIRSIRDKIRN